MTQDNKDDNQDGKTGLPDSSSGDGSGSGNGAEGTPSAGTKNTEPRVPYHQDPELQDYINRQVNNRVEEIVVKNNVSSSAQKDELSDIVDELVSDFQLDNQTAKKYANIIKKVAERVADSKVGNVKESYKSLSLQNKITTFSQQHPDLYELRDDMLSILKTLPIDEQNFIKNSENGIEYLYNKVKIKRISSIPGQNKNLGTSASGSGSSKISGKTILERASELLNKGDRIGYETMMKEHANSK